MCNTEMETQLGLNFVVLSEEKLREMAEGFFDLFIKIMREQGTPMTFFNLLIFFKEYYSRFKKIEVKMTKAGIARVRSEKRK